MDLFWVMDNGTLQSFRYLIINNCPSFETIPEPLKQLITLRHVKATWFSTRIEISLRTLRDHIEYEFQSFIGTWENQTHESVRKHKLNDRCSTRLLIRCNNQSLLTLLIIKGYYFVATASRGDLDAVGFSRVAMASVEAGMAAT
ncbi:hypothetical protein LguiA_018460 [Lonicera macranthoides]